MGLDNATLFVANIVVLLVAAAAYVWVWFRVRAERYWLIWAGANLVFTVALAIYASMPDLPLGLAVWPDTLLLLGFGMKLLAARTFDGHTTPVPAVCAPAVAFVLLAFIVNSQSLSFAIVNVMLTCAAGAVAVAFWRGRGDGLPSRYGLVGVYALIAVSFAVRALQGLFAGGQIVSYIPYDTILQAHLLVALIHIAAGAVFVLSIAYERGALALRRAALNDPLTGLENRRSFETALRDRLAEPRESGFALALFDIDHFKRINDRHGHAAGDAALRGFACACRKALRDGDQLYRIGGEEFALIVAATGVEGAHAIAERVRAKAGDSPVEFEGRRMTMTVSAGVCYAAAGDGVDFDGLLAAADAQLYQAKKHGRNRTLSAQAQTSPIAKQKLIGPGVAA